VIGGPGGQGRFARTYRLDLPGLQEWLFCPGMLFQSTCKWWGDRGSRNRPHEGLDLLLYRDREGKVLHLTERTRIRVISDGMIVGIIQDFLGKSIIVEHAVPDGDDERCYTIYGHTSPQDGICGGMLINGGDIIGTVAAPGRTGFPMAPHLHLSIAWAPAPVSYDHFNWNTLAASELLTLLDPLAVISCDYRMLEHDAPACQDL